MGSPPLRFATWFIEGGGALRAEVTNVIGLRHIGEYAGREIHFLFQTYSIILTEDLRRRDLSTLAGRFTIVLHTLTVLSHSRKRVATRPAQRDGCDQQGADLNSSRDCATGTSTKYHVADQRQNGQLAAFPGQASKDRVHHRPVFRLAPSSECKRRASAWHLHDMS